MGNNRNPRCACPWCNRPGVVAVPVMKRGGGNAYLCEYHGHGGLDRYTAENPLWWGVPHDHALTFSREVELSAMNRKGAIELCANGHRITSDCTVFAEMKSPIYQSLSPLVAYGDTLDRLLESGDIGINQTCGMHFHVGRKPDPKAYDENGHQIAAPRWQAIDESAMEIIRRHYIDLFMPVYKYWYENEEESTSVFGRSWGEWADTFGMQSGRIRSYDGAMEHRLAINVQHDYTVEFRRCFYRNAEQYRRCMYGCTAIVKRLTECLVSYDGTEAWAKKTGQSLVRAWRHGIEK